MSHELSLPDRIYRRLSVPCTATELASIMRRPVAIVRATLCRLQKQGRAQRTDRTIKNTPGRGRGEYLWERRSARMTLSMKHAMAADALLRIASSSRHVGTRDPDGPTCDQYERCALCIAGDAVRTRAICDNGGQRRRAVR